MEVVISRDYVDIKLNALKAKKHTDCSFLVGEDGSELEVHTIE
jgi:hypothetical protein